MKQKFVFSLFVEIETEGEWVTDSSHVLINTFRSLVNPGYKEYASEEYIVQWQILIFIYRGCEQMSMENWKTRTSVGYIMKHYVLYKVYEIE
jgi:hypothetical protein